MKSPSSKSKLIRIAAQELRIHPTAQREIRPNKLKEITAELDLDAIGVLHAVEYTINGISAIWIVDGQHRLKALMDRDLGEWQVEVKIHLDVKDDARASELFLKLNNRAPVNPYDKFDNARRAGHEDAVGITKILNERQLRISRQSGGTNNLTCVTALSTVFKYDYGKTLSSTLDTLIASWGRGAAALEGRLIEGVGILYKTFNGNVDQPALVKKLAKYPGGAPGLIGDARGLRAFRKASVARCIAERVVELYNQGRRVGRLDPL